MTGLFAAGLGAGWASLPPMRRGLALVLGGWIVIVAALAGADVVAGFGTGDAGPAHPGPAAPPGAEAPSLAAITERPLFSMSRRPDPPPSMASAPTAPPPPPPQRDRQLSLRGVYIDGAQAKAFVVSAEHPEGAWVARGSQVGGWQVSAVSAGQVRFEADGETFSASLNSEAGHP